MTAWVSIHRCRSGKRPRKQPFVSFCILVNTECPQSPHGSIWAWLEKATIFGEKILKTKGNLLNVQNTHCVTVWISFGKPRFIISFTSLFLFCRAPVGGAKAENTPSFKSEHQSEADNSSAAALADLISHSTSLFVCNISWRNTSLFSMSVRMKNWFMESWSKDILPFWKPPHYQKTNTLNHLIYIQYSTWLIINDNASQVWFCMLDFFIIYIKMWRC